MDCGSPLPLSRWGSLLPRANSLFISAPPLERVHKATRTDHQQTCPKPDQFHLHHVPYRLRCIQSAARLSISKVITPGSGVDPALPVMLTAL